MTTIFAEAALLPQGWAAGVRVAIAPDGRIATVGAPGDLPAGGDIRADVLLPGVANLHSHAFQRAMAGLTEHRTAGRDSFWTWRETMYRFVDLLEPAEVSAIAAQVQVEAAEAGYSALAEFHYLHHGPGGVPYDDPAEMSHAITAAAAETGLGLTHLPVLYMQGGADGRALSGGQRRFGCDLDGFARLLDCARAGLGALPDDTVLGVAPHSLRAVAPAALTDVAGLIPEAPVHLHIAEQEAEVAEIRAVLGARPIEWLLGAQPVDRRWCLIHATHADQHEVAGMAATGAVVGLCPVTEANLGDGLFPADRLIAAGGWFGIGTDSNLRLDLTGELRLLEYGQRLRERSRAVLCDATRSVGRLLYETAAAGGAQALGRDAGRIEAGRLADLVALDATALTQAGRSGDRALDAWIFSGHGDEVAAVWSAGRPIVRDGRHPARAVVEARFRRVVHALAARL